MFIFGLRLRRFVPQTEIENPDYSAHFVASKEKQFSGLSDVESKKRKGVGMKYVITALLSVALIWTSQVQAAPINNSTSRVKAQAVQVATPEKVATQTLTEQQTSVTSESPDPEQEAKAFIYFKESSNNPAAQNSIGCYGLGQDCNGIVKDKCGASYECQDAFFTEYAKRRYGSFVKAKEFWLARVPINGVDRGNWW